MKTYIDQLNKMIEKLESHIDRLSDSERDNDDKISALEGLRDTLQEGIDNLEAEWPTS
jgi:chaperonin cofactor prefoldin